MCDVWSVGAMGGRRQCSMRNDHAASQRGIEGKRVEVHRVNASRQIIASRTAKQMIGQPERGAPLVSSGGGGIYELR